MRSLAEVLRTPNAPTFNSDRDGGVSASFFLQENVSSTSFCDPFTRSSIIRCPSSAGRRSLIEAIQSFGKETRSCAPCDARLKPPLLPSAFFNSASRPPATTPREGLEGATHGPWGSR